MEDVRETAFSVGAWDGHGHSDVEFRTMCRLLQEVDVRGYPDVYSTKQVPFYEVVKLKRRKGKRGKHPALPISQSSPLR